MEDNKSLITINTSLVKIEKQIAIGEKILSLNFNQFEKQVLETFFGKLLNKEDNIDEILETLSEYYPFSKELIEKYQNILLFDKLSRNENIIWSEDIIDAFLDKWNWEILSQYNCSIPWSLNFIKRYETKLYVRSEIIWGPDESYRFLSSGISNNESIEWTFEILDYYKNSLCWRDICSNNKIIWNVETIEYFIKYIDWNELSLSINLPIEILKKYEANWDWKLLSQNDSLQFTEELIDTFFEKWDWINISYRSKMVNQLFNIKKYKEKLDMKWLIWNWNFIWNKQILIENKYLLSGDNSRRYLLSENTAINWNFELLDEFKSLWNWKALSGNESLPWSKDLINHFEKYWSFPDLEDNQSINWTEELIDKYHLKLNWHSISNYGKTEWSIPLIKKYDDKLHFSGNIYLSIKDFLDKDLVEKVLKKIMILKDINLGDR